MSGATSKKSIRLDRVQRAIHAWVVRELQGDVPPEQVIWRQQSEPLPPRPCVALKVIDGPRRVGYSDDVRYVGGRRFNVGGQRVMTVSVQVFGSTRVHRPMAYQIGIDLNSSLSKATTLEGLRRDGLAVFNQGEVLNLTALEETEFEERSGFDVLFGLAQNVVDDPGIIETANVTPHVHEAGDED